MGFFFISFSKLPIFDGQQWGQWFQRLWFNKIFLCFFQYVDPTRNLSQGSFFYYTVPSFMHLKLKRISRNIVSTKEPVRGPSLPGPLFWFLSHEQPNQNISQPAALIFINQEKLTSQSSQGCRNWGPSFLQDQSKYHGQGSSPYHPPSIHELHDWATTSICAFVISPPWKKK